MEERKKKQRETAVDRASAAREVAAGNSKEVTCLSTNNEGCELVHYSSGEGKRPLWQIASPLSCGVRTPQESCCCGSCQTGNALTATSRVNTKRKLFFPRKGISCLVQPLNSQTSCAWCRYCSFLVYVHHRRASPLIETGPSDRGQKGKWKWESKT